MKRIDPNLHEKLASLVSTLGYDWVGYEFTRLEGRTIFRVYIDSPKGISAGDCQTVSHQISAFLDVEDPIKEKYNLEISSPGLDRPLFSPDQYQQQIGQKVRIRLARPQQKQRNFVGLLQRVENENICLLLEKGEEVILPFSNIDKANVIPDIRF